jgi:predicted RNA-binding protein with TRAM domain
MIEDGAYFKGSIEIDKTGDAGDGDAKASFARNARSTAATSSSVS